MEKGKKRMNLLRDALQSIFWMIATMWLLLLPEARERMHENLSDLNE